ncbi:hypothetical protein EV193_111206 [Herbihabitans rhizosphaerae]|uniref:Peptide subunit release factor 1 (ERF1) n=1 Tax=Herbihabitans rhizosphaerae TaxID=1872711 RepID=A0A4Q7KFC8_9PSEU|nr:hypothetical protein [Herbihabitans rhizosphaerae]RZS32821.1 hypothetical protein EV193_111206 [Herbihabitans rhizosphaerae]
MNAYRSLRHVTDARGPFASVYVDSSHDTEDAARAIELRWRATRQALQEQGADEPTITAVGEAIDDGVPTIGRGGRAIVATGGEVLIDQRLPDAPPVPVARVSELPYLMPVLAARRSGVPHVVATVDRIGVDLRAVDATGDLVASYAREGARHPVHKVGGGGRAHQPIQRRVEQTVDTNVADIAAEIDTAVRRVGADLLALVGEVRARSAVTHALSHRAAEVCVEVTAGARAAGANTHAVEQRVHQLIDARQDQHEDEVLQRFRAEQGRDQGLAVDGLAGTASALRDANVATLFVGDTALSDAMVWTNRDPFAVAAEAAALDGDAESVRADEALPYAALTTGATIVVTDGLDLRDGVGALLRHP